jgi:hypothetical protein
MPDAKNPAAPIPHFEDVNAPMVYADFCMGGGPMMGDNITLTFVAKLLDHNQTPPAANSKTVLRLVMPRHGAADMAEFIRGLLASLEAGGAAPTNATLN